MSTYFIIFCLLIGASSSQEMFGCSEEEAGELSTSMKGCALPLINYGTEKLSELLDVKRETLTQFCRLFKDLFQCVGKTINSTNCIDHSVKGYSHEAIHSTEVGVNYVCANDAKIAYEFFSSNGVLCFMKANPNIKTCFNNRTKNLDFQTFLTNPSEESVKAICEETGPAKLCILNGLRNNSDSCGNRVIEIIHEAMEVVHEASPCDYKRDKSTTQETNQEESPSQEVFGCTEEEVGELSKSMKSCTLPLVYLGTEKLPELLDVKRETLTQFCGLSKDLFLCAGKTINATNCFDDSMKRYSHEAIHSTEAGVNYVCANGANIAYEFFSKNGGLCFMKANLLLPNCFNASVKNSDFQTFLTNPSEERIEAICEEAGPVKLCILNELKNNAESCGNRVIEIMNETMEIVHETSPCKYIRDKPAIKEDQGANVKDDDDEDDNSGTSQEVFGCSEEDAGELSKSMKGCVLPLIRYGTESLSELLDAKSETLTHFCSLFKDLFQCVAKTVNSTNCIYDSVKKYSHEAIHSAEVGVNYVCANDAKIAYEFFSKNGVLCLMNANSYIQKCFNDSAKKLDYQTFLINPPEESVKTICEEAGPAELCILNGLKNNTESCGNFVIEIVHEAMEIVREAPPCEHKRDKSTVKEVQGTIVQDSDDKKDDNGASFLYSTVPLLVLSLILPIV